MVTSRLPAYAAVPASSSTAQRTGEPAWHRRQRRLRGQARTLLRVASATSLLADHHSAQWSSASSSASSFHMRWGKNGGGKGTRGDEVGQASPELQDWVCPINWCGYKNFARRARCRLCEAYPSEGRRLKGGGKGKGSGNGNQTFGHQQTVLARAHAKHQKKEESLKKELAEVKKQRDAAMANRTGSAAVVDEGDDDEPMDEEESEDVEKALALARRKRKALQDVWEDDDPIVQEVEAEVKRLTKKRDEAKPQRVRLRILERKVDKCQKQVDAKAKAVEELDERIKGLQAERDEHSAALASATRELEDARAERTAELQRAIEEENKVGSPSAAVPEVDGTTAGKALEVLVTEARARLPGAGEEVAKAVEGALGQLVALLAQLPAVPPPPPPLRADAPCATPATGAGGGHQSPISGNFQKAAEDRATATDQQRAVAAAARESAQTEARSVAAATAGGPEPSQDNGDGAQTDGSDDESEGEDSICQMQLDRQDNETEQERNTRVSKLLKARAKAKKARAAERKEHRKNKQGGMPSRRIRDPKVKATA